MGGTERSAKKSCRAVSWPKKAQYGQRNPLGVADGVYLYAKTASEGITMAEDGSIRTNPEPAPDAMIITLIETPPRPSLTIFPLELIAYQESEH